jgi:hypothetical protein
VFFAVETGDDFDGRIFAIFVERDALIGGAPEGYPWRTYRTNEIKIWDPAANGIEFPRLVAQSGVLAVGRLPSTQPHRTAWDSEINSDRALLAEEVRRIMSIPIKLTSTGPISDRAVPPIAVTLRIHIDKESVRKDLAGGRPRRRISPPTSVISHKTMYPDVQGLTSHSQFLQGLERGLLLV